jgi:acyl-CoA hydrolase
VQHQLKYPKNNIHEHWVVTEYGLTDLFGKSLKQRAHALIQIAHPDQREALEKAYHKRFG